MPHARPLPALVLAAAVAALGACDAATLVDECVPGVVPTCPTAPPDDGVSGVDVAALFAPPTPAEVDAALALAPGPTAGQATLTAPVDGPDGSRLFTLALDAGPDRVVTALVRVPDGGGLVTRIPVVVVLPGDGGAAAADFLTGPGHGALADRAVQVVMAYRGTALETADGPVASDLPPDPYRADVADLRALVGALGQIPRADPARLAFVGVGRGGTVALLAAPDADADAVVALGAPTDLFAGSFVAEARVRLGGGLPPAPFPALDALLAPAFALRDGTATLAEARVGLAALSPARLRPQTRLPAVLALHADPDPVVGSDQLLSLAGALGGRGVTVLVEGQTHASLPRAAAVQNQVAQFLLDRL